MSRTVALAFALLLAAAGTLPAAAQDNGGADLAAYWTGAPRWLKGLFSTAEAFNGGISRGRFAMGVVRSTVGPDGDVPFLLRFDSTETTLVGRSVFEGCDPFDEVGVFRGSAWDLSETAAPRRLNVLLIENEYVQPPDGDWDPEDILVVTSSTYDGTGTSYSGTCRTATAGIDAAYVARLRLVPGRSPYESSPAEIRGERAFVRSLAAAPSNGAVGLTWAYERADGEQFRLYRRSTDLGRGTLIATLPIAARSYADAGLALDSTYTYRLEAVDVAGQVLHVSGEVGVQPHISQGMTMLGALDPLGDFYADVWGYVGPGGREYALLNTSGGLSIIDVTDDAPVEVGFVPGLSNPGDVEAYGSYAYVAHNGGRVQVVDLTDPTHPVVAYQFWATATGSGNGGVHTLTVAGAYLYTQGQGGASGGGVRIWSLADPARPTFVGEYQQGSVHDIYVRGDTMYAAYLGGGVDIVDIRDRAHPQRISNFTYPENGAHNVCMTEDGRYAFVGDEVGAGRWTRVFDVSDPQDVELVTEIIVDRDATVHNCNVRGNLLFIAHYTEGVRVYDVTVPTAPVEVAFYDTYSLPGSTFGGAWTAYPYLPSGKILVSDLGAGLQVLRLDGAVATAPTPAVPLPLGLRVSPNPVHGVGRVAFTLSAAADVRLTLYDALGREVAVIAEGRLAAGPHDAALSVARLPPGVYLVRLVAGGRSAGARLTVVR